MFNLFLSRQRVSKRIELILGRAQIDDVNYYLFKEYGDSLYNAKWMTTLEAYQKGYSMVVEFNRRKATVLRLSWFYIDDKIFQENFISQNSIVMRQVKQALRAHYLSKLLKINKVWNESTYIRLRINDNMSQIGKERQINHNEKRSALKSLGNKKYRRPEIQIDYKSLNWKESQSYNRNNLGTFIGLILFNSHRLYLVKKRDDKLVNSRWIYCQLTKKDFGNFQKLRVINAKSKVAQKLIVDKCLILSKFKQQGYFAPILDSNPTFSSNLVQKDHQLLIKYEDQIELKEKQEDESQLISNFLLKKLKQLDNNIQNKPSKVSIQQIIGKAKRNGRQLFLTKSVENSNQTYFKWKVNARCYRWRVNQKEIFKQFNTMYGHQPLPFFIPQFAHLKCHFLAQLQSIVFEQIESTIAKKICPEGTFYLTKIKNASITQSKWISLNGNLHNDQFSWLNNKKYNKYFASQSIQFYLDKQAILIELYQQKLQQFQNQWPISSNYQINQKSLYQQTQQLYETFLSQTKKVKQLVSQNFFKRQTIKNKFFHQRSAKKKSPQVDPIKIQPSEQSIIVQKQSNTKKSFSSNQEKPVKIKLIKQEANDKKEKKALKKKEKREKESKFTGQKLQKGINKKEWQKQIQQFERHFSKSTQFGDCYFSDEDSSEYQYEWLQEENN